MDGNGEMELSLLRAERTLWLGAACVVFSICMVSRTFAIEYVAPRSDQPSVSEAPPEPPALIAAPSIPPRALPAPRRLPARQPRPPAVARISSGEFQRFPVATIRGRAESVNVRDWDRTKVAAVRTARVMAAAPALAQRLPPAPAEPSPEPNRSIDPTGGLLPGAVDGGIPSDSPPSDLFRPFGTPDRSPKVNPKATTTPAAPGDDVAEPMEWDPEPPAPPARPRQPSVSDQVISSVTESVRTLMIMKALEKR
jgi:hypothetical protein